MEEKERYQNRDGIYDTIIDDYVDTDVLVNLLNQKEIQKANIKNYLIDYYYLVEKENQQLREDLQAKDILVNTYMSVVGTLDNAKQLKQSQKQLAISVLLKVYQIVKYYNSEVNKFENHIDTLDIEQYIDDQIKELKGE